MLYFSREMQGEHKNDTGLAGEGGQVNIRLHNSALLFSLLPFFTDLSHDITQ